ncbi:TPA: hypothetical protein AB5C29_001009 [Vibrio cholerae]|uniref:hypothetical protein n=2 Tax=Vibrio cholerae TaxID=666 RepID=UPI00027352C3|nr:hypothetical protein [Vibrio cholerae]EGR4442204.1 hypothetical protein [Vibrio cholerae]EJH67100.1 hypothetical protein VCHE25_1055 [Vibrio cholerae HE-25]EJL6314296.1 hypothetical protein [Vibrio cholerae]ELJ8606071.1 hypothetical protein [Vibrio cholerae]KQA39127.1 hypothetical protein XV74_09420 [Vibrio cholerae]
MNKELEQAMALREEAREMLAQSRVMHEVTLSNQRQVTLAVSTLLPRPMIVEMKVDQQDGEAEKVANFAEDMAASMRIRDVYDIVHAINVLAMANTDVLHIFTRFAGHVNSVEVYALSAETIYSDGHPQERLLSERVRLDEDNALESLLAIESQLTELIIEAREAEEIVEEGI